ncbi:DUF1758 domain-containing protein [Trichonephila clavipes]|nr:DUF1758 domain-containing protein [Trichonephila clavipes]
MPIIKSLKKDELLLVAEELELDIPQNPKIIVLKKLIESSEIFETDKEFQQSVIDGVWAEKNAKIEQEKFKLESEKVKIEFKKIKLERLKELELTNARCKLSPAQDKSEHFESVPSDIENLIKSIKTLTIPLPSNTEAYNLFLQSLENAFKTKNGDNKFKAEILLNMLGEKVGNLMIYVKQEELADDSFYVPGPIDCLLGADIFYELLHSGQIRSENSNHIFQNTVFGFVASGSNNFADTEAQVHCGLIKGDLNQTLKMFWELENVEVDRTKNEEAIFCEDHFLKTHSRDDEGRQVVKMSLKNEPNCLDESRDIVLKRLNALRT